MKRQIKLAVLFLSFLIVLPLNVAQAVDDSTEGEKIPFDKIPPALLEVVKRETEYTIMQGMRAGRVINCGKKLEEFINKNEKILEKIRFSKPMYVMGDGLTLAYCPKDKAVKNATKEELSILREYRILVKKFHDSQVEAASLEQFYKAERKLEDLDSPEKDKIYSEVLCRYPEFKDYDAGQVVVYGLLIDSKR